MGGSKTPIIDARLLRDEHAPDWLANLHRRIVKGSLGPSTKVPPFMRRLMVSEAAALQGFPPGFVFCGSQCEKFRQIVPPPFVEHVARVAVAIMND